MNRNLSKRPKVVRKLDGALTAWRYFHGPNFVHEARDRLKIRTHSDSVRALLREATARAILIEENQALFSVLVAFVKWMQAPISPWAGSPFVEFVDDTGTRKVLRSEIARAMSKGRPNSPFFKEPYPLVSAGACEHCDMLGGGAPAGERFCCKACADCEHDIAPCCPECAA